MGEVGGFHLCYLSITRNQLHPELAGPNVLLARAVSTSAIMNVVIDFDSSKT